MLEILLIMPCDSKNNISENKSNNPDGNKFMILKIIQIQILKNMRIF